MLVDAAKCQGYIIDHVWVIKEKPTEEAGVKLRLTQIMVKGFRY